MLDTELITYLANLSKLGINDDEREKMVSEMSAIVDLMDTMNDVVFEDDVDLQGEGVSIVNLREDKARESFDRDQLLANASYKKDGFFVVPKIME